MVATLLFVVLILFAGLWPFDPWPENRVMPLDGGKGLHFAGEGLVLSEGREAETIRSLFQDRAITMELWVKPTGDVPGAVSGILAFYDSRNGKSFFVGQWRSHLLVRTQTSHPARANRNYREIGLRDGLNTEDTSFITITSDMAGTRIYGEGVLVRAYSNYNVFPESATFEQVLVGNTPAGKQGWTGDFFGLGLYRRSLTSEEVLESCTRWKDGTRSSLSLPGTVAMYCFQEPARRFVRNCAAENLHLLIPERFVPPRKIMLSRSREHLMHGWSSLQDVLINIAGFVPLGFLLCAFLRTNYTWNIISACFITVAAAAFLSLSVEFLQAWFPSRDSSLADLAFNTLGGVLGGVAALLLPGRKITSL